MSSVDILVPDLPESVADASVATWHKKPGDSIQRDEVLVEIETDKVVLEVPASEAGVLESILEDEGATVGSRQLLGRIRLGDSTGIPADVKPAQDSTPAQRQSADIAEKGNNDALSPTARRLVAEHDVNPADVKGSGVGGRLTRQDIEGHVANKTATKPVEEAPQALLSHRSEKRVPMTRLRKRVAERLLEAKNTTAMLTTFNEINMQPIKDLRAQYGEAFEKRHGVR